MILTFSLTWGIGGGLYNDTLNPKLRSKFSQMFKSKIANFYPSLPNDGELYDYYIDWGAIRLKMWDDKVEEFNFDINQAFFNIFVPTIDTIKYTYILKTLVSHNFNVLITGNSGVGKSNVINRYISSLDQDSYLTKNLNFSA
jgi:dynein heavy chain